MLLKYTIRVIQETFVVVVANSPADARVAAVASVLKTPTDVRAFIGKTTEGRTSSRVVGAA